MEYTDSKLSPLEQRVINWVLQHRKEYDELVDKGIFSADIVNYMINNECEDVLIEWIIPLLYKEDTDEVL